jgi:hypothetical protein
MSEPRKYRVQASTTTYTYVYSWSAAREALSRAEKEPMGSFYFYMMAGVFSAFAIEGFLNHIGQRKVRDWEVFERKLGPREKLLFLQRVLHFPADASQRPFQTLRDMMRLRDALAHGKTETVTSDAVVANPHDEDARYPAPLWRRLCSAESVGRMVEDAEAMIRVLNELTGSERDPLASPGQGSAGVIEGQ